MGIRAKTGLFMFLIIVLSSSLVVLISATPHFSANAVEKFAAAAAHAGGGAGRGGGGSGRGGGGSGRGGGGAAGRGPLIIGGAAGAVAAASHHGRGGHRSSGHRIGGESVRMLLCAFLGFLLGGNVWM